MTEHPLEANKEVARTYLNAFNAADLDTLEPLLADDFVWHTAVIGDNESQPRPYQSTQLAALMDLYAGPLRKDKSATCALFKDLFDPARGWQFRLRLVSLTAEDNRVAMEAEGDAINPANGRRYRNLYFVLMHIRDGKIALYKEYQDTLHIYDVFAVQ